MTAAEFALTMLHRYQFQIDRQPNGQKIVRAIGGRVLTAAEKDIAASLTKYFNQHDERTT